MFLVLEGNFHLAAIGSNLAIFDDEILLHNFGYPQVSERFCSAFDGNPCRILPDSVLVPTNSITL